MISSDRKSSNFDETYVRVSLVSNSGDAYDLLSRDIQILLCRLLVGMSSSYNFF